MFSLQTSPKDHRPRHWLGFFSGGRRAHREAPCKETRPKHNIMFVGPAASAADAGKTRSRQRGGRGPPLQLSVLAGTRSATVTGTFFPLEAKLQPPQPINHFLISGLTSEQTEAQVLHVLIFKCMLTSNVGAPNRSHGHLARSPAPGGRPPDGESVSRTGAGKEEGGRRKGEGRWAGFWLKGAGTQWRLPDSENYRRASRQTW